jgi:Ca2+/H+ antiporter
MDLNFEIFMVVVLILSILVVGRFLQDGSSNYLEGTLLVVSAFFILDACILLRLLSMLIWNTMHGRVLADCL